MSEVANRQVPGVASKAQLVCLLGSLIGSQFLLWLLLIEPIKSLAWWSGYRNYYPSDMLSYAAISVNFAQGDVGLDEPYTQTGSLYYPSAWYVAIGIASRLTGLAVPAVWQLSAIALVCVTVLITGLISYRISGQAWAPLIPAVLLFSGTLSTLQGHGWFTIFESHAVIWGPYASLWALNAEVAGLCCVALALSLTALYTSGSSQRWYWLALGAGLLGLTANFHTYAFITGSVIAIWWVALEGFGRKPRRALLAVSLALLMIALVSGPFIAQSLSPLVCLLILLLPPLPGVLMAWRRRPRLGLAILGPFLLLAMPQIVRTLIGVLQSDPFLVYRQSSSKDLGIPILGALIGDLIPLLILVACLTVPLTPRSMWVRPLGYAFGISWVLMAFNDRWGFNQEPYRFNIQFIILAAFVLAIIAPIALRASWGTRKPLILALLVASVASYLLALGDIRGFRTTVADSGIIDMDSADVTSLRRLPIDRQTLALLGPCLNPQIVKVATGARIPYYSMGIAWPADVERIDLLRSMSQAEKPSAEVLRELDVEQLITDERCSTKWVYSPSELVVSANVEGNYRHWVVLR